MNKRFWKVSTLCATFTYHKYACILKAYLTNIIYVNLTTPYYVIWTRKKPCHPVYLWVVIKTNKGIKYKLKHLSRPLFFAWLSTTCLYELCSVRWFFLSQQKNLQIALNMSEIWIAKLKGFREIKMELCKHAKVSHTFW